MLEFPDIDMSITYYTTSKFVLEKFNPIEMKRVLAPEEAELVIIDSESHSINAQYYSNKRVFCIDQPIEGCWAVFSKENVVAYLNMIDRMTSDDYLVSMADPYSDVMHVSGGKLIHLGRYPLDISENEIYTNLPQELAEKKVGIIIFVSKSNHDLLYRVGNRIDLMCPNGQIVIMAPSHENQLTESYIEVYVFEYVHEST